MIILAFTLIFGGLFLIIYSLIANILYLPQIGVISLIIGLIHLSIIKFTELDEFIKALWKW